MHQELNYLDFEIAKKRSLDLVSAIAYKEIIPIKDAIGKVLSSDVLCVKNLPSFNNSAMDGFAIKYDDAGKTLSINKIIYAGDKGENVKESLRDNECYKIMTGAKVPADVDTIIPIENCSEITFESVKIPLDIKKGSNLRLKGEELKKGSIMLRKGEKITSSHITLLASQGLVMVEVYRNISIAVLSSGNEIKEPWQSADEEEIFNCNSYGIISLLKEKNFDATYCGVIPDNLEESKIFIKNLKNYDVIITTGGISMGDADFVGEAFLQNGLDVAFHGVNIKPGRPIMMGKIDNTVVICLPGNPLTAIVNIYLFVIPMLKKLQGEISLNYGFIKAINKKEFKTKKGRVNVILGKFENGNFYVTRDNRYGSGMITVLYESNAILVTKEDTSQISLNQDVKILRFNTDYFEDDINILN